MSTGSDLTSGVTDYDPKSAAGIVIKKKILDQTKKLPTGFILPTHDNTLLIENNLSDKFNTHIKSSTIIVTFNDTDYILNAIKSEITLSTIHYAELLTDPNTINYNPPLEWIDYTSFLQPVRDQETYGTCVPFAIASIVEFHFSLQNITNDYLSPAFIYVSRPTISNIKSTSDYMSLQEGLNIICNNGIVTETMYPYTKDMLTTKLSNRIINEGLSNTKFKNVVIIKTISELKSAITNHGPCVITIKIYSSESGKINPDNIIWKSTPGYDTLQGSHAVSVVGYDPINFKIRNSWGIAFGKNGYIDIPFSDWNCVIDCMTIMPDIEIPYRTGEVIPSYKQNNESPWWHYLILFLAVTGSVSIFYQMYVSLSSYDSNDYSKNYSKNYSKDYDEETNIEEERFGGRGIYPEIK